MKVYRRLAQIMTLKEAHAKDGRRLLPSDLSLIENAAIVFDQEKIHWLGPDHALPSAYQEATSFDLAGHVLTPGLVDSHTHLVFAGNRAHEYAQRLNGESYQQIAQAGGGILHTMQKTRALSEDDLFELAAKRLARIASYGVSTLELKSGYALTHEGELRLLRVAKRLKRHVAQDMRLFSTYMGAHAVPADFKNSAEYVSQVVIPTLHAGHAEGLIDGVDVFHEQGYFTTADSEMIFAAAQRLGLPVKIHADEFQDNQGAALAVKHQALSADHLLHISDAGIQALAHSCTVATLLPGTAFFLGKSLPRARALLDAGCRVAIASDFNPGSSHVDNVLLIASLAAASLKMNQAELWAALTLNGAHALGWGDQGALLPGMKPLFSLFSAAEVSEITYSWGQNLARPLP